MAKIALFLSDLGGGGAEKVFINLAHGLIDFGHDVDLVVAQCHGPYISHLDNRIKLVDLKASSLLNCFPKLRKYLQTSSPSLLISALEDTNLIAILASRTIQTSIPVIVTVHNALSQEAKHMSSIKRRVVPYLLRWIYPWSDAVVAVSEGVAQDLRNLGVNSNIIKVIYNPIVSSRCLSLYDAEATHPWLDPSFQLPIILGVGRLTQQKGFQTLLRAFALVLQQFPCKLILLGEGDERNNLLALANSLGLVLNDDFSVPGFVENPYCFMAKASVLALSSKWEGFGNVLVESMAIGTPVVSTQCKYGPDEILNYGKYGILVPVDDFKELAKAIIRTIKHPPDKDLLRNRALEFSEEAITEKYLFLASSLSKCVDLQ